MSWRQRARDYWPRRAEGLPTGQREVAAFPRFSDDPFRAAPLAQPQLDISVEGDTVASLDLSAWSKTAAVQRTHDFHCVTTWSYRDVAWSGYPLAELLSAAGVAIDELPAFARAHGADKRHAVFMTEDLLDPSVLVATQLDGEPVPPRHGGSLRLVSPNQYGYKSVKHLIEIDFTAIQPKSSFGGKEHLRARIALEERHSTRPNWMVRLPYRLMIVPTALAADRSMRKSPD